MGGLSFRLGQQWWRYVEVIRTDRLSCPKGKEVLSDCLEDLSGGSSIYSHSAKMGTGKYILTLNTEQKNPWVSQFPFWKQILTLTLQQNVFPNLYAEPHDKNSLDFSQFSLPQNFISNCIRFVRRVSSDERGWPVLYKLKQGSQQCNESSTHQQHKVEAKHKNHSRKLILGNKTLYNLMLLLRNLYLGRLVEEPRYSDSADEI